MAEVALTQALKIAKRSLNGKMLRNALMEGLNKVQLYITIVPQVCADLQSDFGILKFKFIHAKTIVFVLFSCYLKHQVYSCKDDSACVVFLLS